MSGARPFVRVKDLTTITPCLAGGTIVPFVVSNGRMDYLERRKTHQFQCAGHVLSEPGISGSTRCFMAHTLCPRGGNARLHSQLYARTRILLKCFLINSVSVIDKAAIEAYGKDTYIREYLETERKKSIA